MESSKSKEIFSVHTAKQTAQTERTNANIVLAEREKHSDSDDSLEVSRVRFHNKAIKQSCAIKLVLKYRLMDHNLRRLF